MKEANGILMLGRNDLTKSGKKKRIKNIKYTDIAFSLEFFKDANIVLFIDDDKNQIKILKTRYQLII